jgi:light-regulated signal transduction histidine kinase (bacteriophytochrome)
MAVSTWSSRRPVGSAQLPEALRIALEGGSTGYYEGDDGAQYFTAEHVPETPLRLISTVAASNLFTPVQGPVNWLPWLVLAALAVTGMYLLRVLRTVSRTGTQLALATVELQRSNRELQDFAAIASHDLQEPLRKIQSFGDRLSATVGPNLDEDASDYLQRMQDAAARMQSLIQDLLAYSRLATRPEENRPVDLQAVVAEVLYDLEARVQATGAAVTVDELPTLSASPFQMRQLFQNLIANALKFQKPGTAPQVRITAERAGATDPARKRTNAKAWTIRVSDNGIGVDERYAEKIFAPFQRLHGRTEYEGTGMGLAICRRIVERHGGTINVESKPGEGTTFVITLPARKTRRAKS